MRHALNIEQATRYLGVFFNMDLSWREQIQVIRGKFHNIYDRINRTRPTAEMATYCLNAVVNAALKFPLQVAAIPVTMLREWDSKNRGIVKKAAFLPRNTCPELIHLPKREGGRGLQSLEHEISILRIQTQMRLLNAHSNVGAVVRAAKPRHDRETKRDTIQYILHFIVAKHRVLEFILQDLKYRGHCIRTVFETLHYFSIQHAWRDGAVPSHLALLQDICGSQRTCSNQ